MDRSLADIVTMSTTKAHELQVAQVNLGPKELHHGDPQVTHGPSLTVIARAGREMIKVLSATSSLVLGHFTLLGQHIHTHACTHTH